MKPPVTEKKMQEKSQPPSGGCVLKPDGAMEFEIKGVPAAFRRLCVETFREDGYLNATQTSRLQAAVC